MNITGETRLGSDSVTPSHFTIQFLCHNSQWYITKLMEGQPNGDLKENVGIRYRIMVSSFISDKKL